MFNCGWQMIMSVIQYQRKELRSKWEAYKMEPHLLSLMKASRRN